MRLLHTQRLQQGTIAGGKGKSPTHARDHPLTEDERAAVDEGHCPRPARSEARAKASRQHDEPGNPYRSFRGLLDHLAFLTRNHIRYPNASAGIPMFAHATTYQRRAIELINSTTPLTPT